MRLADKVAVITGADSGIGQAIAIAFAREGADVVVDYLDDREGAEETVSKVRGYNRRALLVQADVSDLAAVERLFQEAIEQLGRVDILVNNAAIGADDEFLKLKPEDWLKVMATNLNGPFWCAQQAARQMVKQGSGGKIINISSVHEDIPSKGGAAYCTSKGGLRMLMRNMALELAEHRINVNNIGPGMIATPMTADTLLDQEQREEALTHIPWKRPGRPGEIAHLAVYLASDESDYVTGSTFFIDGGLIQMQGQGA